jgi:FkbM family methyltransferase
MVFQKSLEILSRRIKLYLWRFLRNFNRSSIHSFYLSDGSIFDYPFDTTLGCSLFIGAFEMASIDFVMKTLKKGDIFFDVGANGGIYTVMASKVVGDSGHVYAFEPGKRELHLLRENILKNRLSNVTIVEKAVSNCTANAMFAISSDGAMNSLFENQHPKQIIEEWQEIETVSLDDFRKEFGVGEVNFIKIDVEGAENLVFEGAQQLLSGSEFAPPIVLFEASELTSPKSGISVKEFLNEVGSGSMRVYIIDKNSNLIPLDTCNENPEIGKKIYNFVAISAGIPIQ